MTFTEAESKLAALARGKHHQCEYARRTYGDGSKQAECSLYIEGRGIFRGPTWREAFEKMMFPAPSTIEPAPDFEA